MRILRSLAAAALVAAASCGGGGSDSVAGPSGNPTGGNPSGGNPSGGNTNPSPTNAVSVSNNLFTPANIQVAVGTTVTWTWESGVDTHNVTFADGTGSGDRGPGSTFSKTFQTAGTFAYNCTLHGGMSGSVLVK